MVFRSTSEVAHIPSFLIPLPRISSHVHSKLQVEWEMYQSKCNERKR